jgi:hypothetical protein
MVIRKTRRICTCNCFAGASRLCNILEFMEAVRRAENS